MSSLITNGLRFPDNIAIVDNTGNYTYRHLQEQAITIAKNTNLLTGTGSTTVLFMVSSSYRYVAVLWGIWLAGKIAVPVHIGHSTGEINYLIENSGATLFISEALFMEKVGSAVGQACKSVQVETMLLPNDSMILPELAPEQDALIIYTSGTTGKPKGVVMNHMQIETQLRSLSQAWEWTGRDRILNVLPMHHVHGLINITCCALYHGATVEMQPSFDPGHVRDRMCSGELTLFMAVPTVYHKLIQYYGQLSATQQIEWVKTMNKMRLMVSGSAALPLTVLERWENISGHRLLERYGMTEIGMALSNPLQGERKPGYVGRPLPFVNAKIVDDEGAEIITHSVPGELYISGPTVFKRYWQKPEETKKAFEGAWFKTGDIVERDRDGDYRILGRSSTDIIKSGGYKISALEIEQAMSGHPGVVECAVIALPSEEWGEVIAAVIVGNADPEDLKDWLKTKLALYKTPRYWKSLDALPRNAMGKILKKKLKTLFV